LGARRQVVDRKYVLDGELDTPYECSPPVGVPAFARDRKSVV
jgi:hypothetical protein